MIKDIYNPYTATAAERLAHMEELIGKEAMDAPIEPPPKSKDIDPIERAKDLEWWVKDILTNRKLPEYGLDDYIRDYFMRIKWPTTLEIRFMIYKGTTKSHDNTTRERWAYVKKRERRLVLYIKYKDKWRKAPSKYRLTLGTKGGIQPNRMVVTMLYAVYGAMKRKYKKTIPPEILQS